MTEEVNISETSVSAYRSTWRHIPEYLSLHQRHREALRFVIKISALQNFLTYWSV